MERPNNFKRFFEEEESLCPPPPIQISHRITGNIKTYRFIGDVTDLFMPKLISTMVGVLGGRGSERPDDELQPDQQNGSNPHNRG